MREQQKLGENKQKLIILIQNFIAEHKETKIQDVLQVVRDLAELESSQKESPRQGRWAKFANRIHKESPLRGLSTYVQECSKEFREDFTLDRQEE